MTFKKIVTLFAVVVVVLVVAIFIVNSMVVNKTKQFVYSTTETIPYNKVGLLLGTGKYLSNGNINLYYQYRIDAAFELYKSGKISNILISGDNGTDDYNEPLEMKNDLIALGVPEDHIFLDYAGFRTLDSVVRCKNIFGQESITVISQQFHNERAIYLANANQIEAVGYNAKDVEVSYGLKTQVREKLARCKMMLDLMFGKKPKYGGDTIEIP
ncbi:SanA/YdcF family protein [Neptunitalea lumnitzerae]|uniref:Protein SanA n=1 Tax=Neptunitalea lumnitzerae TaxID=2965509 RepID=A0ABQ5ML96_9FLAO|nr:ElyC/SanA/YdcF family protein [Neptunitalea sp. Y10]GLB50183.1 protein SanA [Neptunitalea sp. Y10]